MQDDENILSEGKKGARDMHTCAQPAWTIFEMQAGSHFRDLYTGNAHFVANFFWPGIRFSKTKIGEVKNGKLLLSLGFTKLGAQNLGLIAQ
jgi:hypothetical protein